MIHTASFVTQPETDWREWAIWNFPPRLCDVVRGARARSVVTSRHVSVRKACVEVHVWVTAQNGVNFTST